MYHAEDVNVNEPLALFAEIDAGQHHGACFHSIVKGLRQNDWNAESHR